MTPGVIITHIDVWWIMLKPNVRVPNNCPRVQLPNGRVSMPCDQRVEATSIPVLRRRRHPSISIRVRPRCAAETGLVDVQRCEIQDEP
jgi:hypothetical protein